MSTDPFNIADYDDRFDKNRVKWNGKTLCIDFDGVIHAYSKGWSNGDTYDFPLPHALETIQLALDTGFRVFIMSTRNPRQVKSWLDRIKFQDYQFTMSGLKVPFKYRKIPFWKKFWDVDGVVGITKRKLPATVYLDDRAIKFNGDWPIAFSKCLTFKTWQEDGIDPKNYEVKE